MPAQVTSLRFCAQWFMTFHAPSRSSPGAHHVVTFERGGGAHCTCKAFSNARRDVSGFKECRHILDVMCRACLWNEQWYNGGALTLEPADGTIRGATAVDGDECPACGGAVVRVLVGV